mmetsp:Transcript_34138/g.86832  ORF Transcript_34138/g.86832 Transcript_34138/m.86832 type:complete len:247 (-) Transcript_34138:206-946(-)
MLRAVAHPAPMQRLPRPILRSRHIATEQRQLACVIASIRPETLRRDPVSSVDVQHLAHQLNAPHRVAATQPLDLSTYPQQLRSCGIPLGIVAAASRAHASEPVDLLEGLLPVSPWHPRVHEIGAHLLAGLNGLRCVHLDLLRGVVPTLLTVGPARVVEAAQLDKESTRATPKAQRIVIRDDDSCQRLRRVPAIHQGHDQLLLGQRQSFHLLLCVGDPRRVGIHELHGSWFPQHTLPGSDVPQGDAT